MKKLYIVVRNDLEPGLQMAQTVHGLTVFEDAHPELYQAWKRRGNLACLQARDEAHLSELIAKAVSAKEQIKLAGFNEPDLDGALTAVAFSEDAFRILSSLPKALRAPKK